jgi:hypothetical protein
MCLKIVRDFRFCISVAECYSVSTFQTSIFSQVSTLRDPENDGFTIFRKVRTCLQIDTASFPVRQKLSKEPFAEMGQAKKTVGQAGRDGGRR